MSSRVLALSLCTAAFVAVSSSAVAQRAIDGQQRAMDTQHRAVERSGDFNAPEADDPFAAQAHSDEGGVAGSVEPIMRELVIPSTALARTVAITHIPGDYRRLFLVEQWAGRVRMYDMVTDQFLDTQAQPFLIVSPITTASEQGLLGLAFHPDHKSNGHLFVNFTTTLSGANATIVRRYTVCEHSPNAGSAFCQANPTLVDPLSRKNIMSFTQTNVNHNGGWIGFGPDGYLYIATGDGGGAGDPNNAGQNLNSRLGKMLRVDVDVDPAPFVIPADNPFVGQSGLDEIWAYGLRNPWRNSFDREFGDLYIADVGQNAWEEVNFQHADSTGGENYGWKCYEGTANFSTFNCPGSPPLSWPFHVYGISGSPRCSVIGGYVYRGCNIPTLSGTYFFGDFCPGHVFSVKYDRDGNVPQPSSSPPASHPVSNFTDHTGNLGAGVSQITTFGQDADGEIYFGALSGAVYRIVPVTPTIKAADLNCSGSVDGFDLLQLLGAWGDCWGCKEDLNGDGVVNGFDLLELLGEWG